MQHTIKQVCEELTEFLLAKNKAYGDSASNPVRIFSKTDPLEQINIRIDDKLSRIARGNEFDGDDTELDLIGYLVLKRAIKHHEKYVAARTELAELREKEQEQTLRREAPGRSGYQMVDPVEQYCDEAEVVQPANKTHILPIKCAHKNTTPILPEANYGYTAQCLDCGTALNRVARPYDNVVKRGPIPPIKDTGFTYNY